MQIHYEGERTADGCIVRVSDARTGRLTLLAPKNNVANHSPNGFEWGYSGSGPAQLALAICCHALKDDARAMRIHQEFKFKVIAGIEGDSWSMTRPYVLSQIYLLEAARVVLERESG